jgi:hypothetical protein
MWSAGDIADLSGEACSTGKRDEPLPLACMIFSIWQSSTQKVGVCRLLVSGNMENLSR